MSMHGNWGAVEWEKTHATGYQQKVYSITHEPMVCDKIAKKITQLFPQNIRMLLPGCGSAGRLEKRLAERSQNDMILCTDFKGVIRYAPKPESAKIRYEAHSNTELPFHNEFDAVVVANSIVSGSDKDNILMLENCYDALVPNGYMVGYFPTVQSAIDIVLNTSNQAVKDVFDTISDFKMFSQINPDSDAKQIFYSAGALEKRLSAIGFEDIEMGIVFFNTPYLKQEGKRLYNLKDDDVPIYEYLVTAQKPPKIT